MKKDKIVNIASDLKKITIEFIAFLLDNKDNKKQIFSKTKIFGKEFNDLLKKILELTKEPKVKSNNTEVLNAISEMKEAILEMKTSFNERFDKLEAKVDVIEADVKVLKDNVKLLMSLPTNSKEIAEIKKHK